MEEQETVIESLVENVEQYTTTTIELMKLRFVLKASDAISNMAAMIVLFVMGFLTLVFLSIGAALWIGMLLGSGYIGFLIVAGFYGVTGSLVYLLRKRIIKTPIANGIINHLID